MRHVSILLVFLLAGCAGAPPTDKPVAGGTLTQALIGDPDTFNPVLARTPSSLEVTRLLFVGLVGPPDSTGTVQPELAERWQISADRRRFVFTLRPGLVWSDGDPLDADDVVFTYNQVYFNARMPVGVRLVRVTPPTVRALDPLTVEFVLDQPDAEFLNRTEPILPKHLLSADLKSEGDSLLDVWGMDTNPTSLVGNGPFLCTGYRPGKQLVLQANPRYWRKPQPYVKTLDYTIAANQADAFAQFRASKLDVYRPAAADYATLYAEQGSGNFTLINSGPQPELTFLAFNLNRGRKDDEPLVNPVRSAWFNDARFRRAVAYALDREAMVGALGGAAQADTYPSDAARAMSLLEEAGFRRDAESKLQDAAGNPVRFTLLTSADSSTQRALAEIVRRDLEGLGIEVEVKGLPLNTLRNRLKSTLRWEAVLGSLAGAAMNPLGQTELWHSQAEWHLFNQQRPQLKGQQVSAWEQELDGLLARAGAEGDSTRRQALKDQMTEIIKTQMPLIPTVHPLAITAVRNRVRNVKPAATDSAVYGRALGNIWEVQVDN
ncbi:MAG: ABC transporter substrate-binding protein [Gemmatimonadaceae bacterium]|nr:ABC transporter substrate-binding protein [Gloeobacterales cyanobacterium ES-bin-141]